MDAAYVPIQVSGETFADFANSLRGGSLGGLNVTIPFKEEALAVADHTDEAARTAGAANVLLFGADGSIEARNTDGLGLLAAFAEQAPSLDLRSGPVVILGAGGAARGAAAALVGAGAPEVRFVNRTLSRATALADRFGGRAYALDRAGEAFDSCNVIINATPAGVTGAAVGWPLDAAPADAGVMDMVYRPVLTPLLAQAAARGMPIVDGLAMLIHQAAPSFQAFFRETPPPLDARALLLKAIG